MMSRRGFTDQTSGCSLTVVPVLGSSAFRVSTHARLTTPPDCGGYRMKMSPLSLIIWDDCVTVATDDPFWTVASASVVDVGGVLIVEQSRNAATAAVVLDLTIAIR